jgi:hypothetical protein
VDLGRRAILGVVLGHVFWKLVVLSIIKQRAVANSYISFREDSTHLKTESVKLPIKQLYFQPSDSNVLQSILTKLWVFPP